MPCAVRVIKSPLFSGQNLLKNAPVRGYLVQDLRKITSATGLLREARSNAFDWRAKAACRDKDPELFFPVGNTGAAYNQIEEAKAVCRTCKVIDACLKCALDTNQDYGVWGGLSEDERRALKRRAMRARRSQAMQMQI